MSNSAFSGSLFDFFNAQGKTLKERNLDLCTWVEKRKESSVFPFSRVLLSTPLHQTIIADCNGLNGTLGINFASQDYLGLVYNQQILDAAHAIIDECGVHSAGSPVLCGRTKYSLELESKLADITGYEDCTLYPTGWSAGFSVIAGQVRENDTIIMDSCCHNCLTEGARHVTKNIRRFAHNNIDQLSELLRLSRQKDTVNGLFIVIESLYSMDSDTPDLNAIVDLAKKYEAIVILDIAHDFGALGETGLGFFETLTSDFRDHVVLMGSFSKTFASNGGFVIGNQNICQYLRYFSGAQVFSNAISPVQTAVVNKAFDIAFSDEGKNLRLRLMKNINYLRSEMTVSGLIVSGIPSPIIPVFLGKQQDSNDILARLTAKHILKNGLHANLAEFPGVPLGKARFRFQVMATHEENEIKHAAEIMAVSRESALDELRTLSS